MFIAIQNNGHIAWAADTKEELLSVLTDAAAYTIEETEEDYVLCDGQFVSLADTAAMRQKDFENKFLLTSLGNYRLVPEGYANAQQSIDTVHNNVNIAGGLTAQITTLLIFYETPDFTKPEQCTEEWLVAHQTHPEPMTLEQWNDFYVEFSTAYALKMHKKRLQGGL